MWVQRLQRSKVLKVFLVLVVLMASFTASTTKAVGLDTAVKIVAGSSAQKVVRAIGEKAGMKFTKESLDSTTKYINGKAAAGDQKYIDLAKNINTVSKTGVDDVAKPGWKKYVLEPALWLTGADLLIEAYDAFNDARTGDTDIDFYEMGNASCGWYWKAYTTSQGNPAISFHHKSRGDSVLHFDVSTSPGVYSAEVTSTGSYSAFFRWGQNGALTATKEIVDYSINPVCSDYDYEEFRARKVSLLDFPDISTVDDDDLQTYRTTIDNDDYTKVTYDNDIEIYAPDTDVTYNNDYTTPWNTKMPDDEFTLIVQPIQDVDVIVPGDDDDLPTGPRPDPVEVIDRSMLDVARQSYDYLGDSVDTAISGMRDVTDNVTGLITFLDDTFDWLPAEWRALFGSAFILGVFAHFFRR